MRLLVAVDHDVEHGVQAGAGTHRVAQGVLFDGDAHGRLARAVQDGRNETPATQAAGLAAAGDVAGMYHEFDSIHVSVSC